MKKPLFITFGCLGATGIMYLLIQLFKIVGTDQQPNLFFCLVAAYGLLMCFMVIVVMLMVDFGGAKDD